MPRASIFKKDLHKMGYQQFAHIYDQLMEDAPYEQWLAFILKNWQLNGNGGKRLLDLGCGTGTLSILLAEKGFEVTGIDLSEDMLAIAQAKTFEAGVHVSYFQQDMRDLSGFEPFDMIGIFCDALNYLKTEKDVQTTFANIYEHLSIDGLLLFDVHSVYKMETVFKGQTFSSTDDDVSYIWNCFAGDELYSVEHELTFFVKDEDCYRRFDEYHYQRTFPVEVYREWLENTGFKVVSITADFTEKSPLEMSERIFFVAKKIKQN